MTPRRTTACCAARVLMLVENNCYPRDPRVRREAEALTRAGYRVSVISPARPRQRWRETIDGVHVYRFPAPPPAKGLFSYLYEYGYSMAAMFLITIWIYLHEDFDIIHVANPPDTLVFIAAFYKLLGKRFIFDHHDLAPEMYCARFPGAGNPLVYRLLIWCEKVSCRLADLVFATNESYKAIEISRDGIKEECVTVLRNGPDPRTSSFAQTDPSLRTRAGIIIAYAGIIGIQDGVDFLLRALHRLIVEFGRTDVLCVVIGDGDAVPSLKHLVWELALGDFVWFAGWVDNPDAYLRYLSTADICVDPSPSNAYNDSSTAIKLMEYMALGKPVVAFDLPEHRFTAQSAAVYAQPNNEHKFAQAIVELMDDPARREKMGSLGRSRVERELAWRHSVPKLLAAYRALLSPASVQVAPAANYQETDFTK